LHFSNRTNLPDVIRKAVLNDGYDGHKKSDITVSTLIAPPQINVLRKKFRDFIVVDVEDRLYSLFGSAIHKVFEQAGESSNKDIIEERFYAMINGMSLSGQVDRLIPSENKISDWKFTGVNKIIYSNFEDWEKQLNCYAYLARLNGYQIEKLEVIAVLRNWERMKVKTQQNYPESMIQIVEIPVWADQKIQAFIEKRIELHQNARAGTIAPCTEEEKWTKDHIWALMKKGRKTAVKLFKNKRDIPSVLEKEQFIQFRKGESLRCENYCDVKDFCPQYDKEKQDGK
tara:strand:- start:1333 stop:2187 length:855 start_codon:yes stop_codon:yes gene_type:complete